MKDVGLRPRPRDSNWSKRTKNRSHCVRFATSFQRVERFGLPAGWILRLPFTSTLRKSSISGCRKRRDKISYPNNLVVEFFSGQFRYAWHATRRTFISSLLISVYYVYYETCIKLSIRFRTGFPLRLSSSVVLWMLVRFSRRLNFLRFQNLLYLQMFLRVSFPYESYY